MTDRRPPNSIEDLGRLVIGMMKRQSERTRVALTVESGDGGTTAPPYVNPMEDEWDLTRGAEGGSPVRFPMDGADGDVLTAQSDGSFAWEAVPVTSGYTDEQVRDVIGATLVEGTNVTITVDDALNTITISATGGGGGTSSGFYLYHMEPTDDQPTWLTYEGTVLWA